MATHKNDKTLGHELGIKGCFENTPSFEIINDAHDRFLALTGRLIDLEYGSYGHLLKTDRRWVEISAQKVHILDRLQRVGRNAVEAAEVYEEIQSLDAAVDRFVSGKGD